MRNQQKARTRQREEGSISKSRTATLKFLIIILPMWLSAKVYSGPYFEFIRSYVAAILLIICLALLLQLVLNQIGEKSMLISLFVILSLVQVCYLLMPSLFSGIGFSIGPAPFFQGEYSLHLIPYYGVGGFIGFFILKQCRVSR